MATETVASDHASTTDEQIVKLEKDEAIAEKIISLATEDEDKQDKPEDTQVQATLSSKTEGEAQRDEVQSELDVAETKKSDDSPALEASAEDDKKVEPTVAVEKTSESVPLESNVAVADNVKEEKELVFDSQTVSVTELVHDAAKSQTDEPPPSIEPAEKETPNQLQKEPTQTDEPKTEFNTEASAETIEKSSNTAEANPLTESEVKVVKEAEIPKTNDQKEEKPVPADTEVQEKTEEPEKESQEKSQEVEQPSTDEIPEPSAESNEKPSDTIEKKITESSAEILKETDNVSVEPTETGKAESVETEVEENQKEPEKQSLNEEEQPNTSAIPEHSAETSDDAIAIEEKTREPEIGIDALKETNNHEAGPTETEIVEPVVTQVDEIQSEPEEQSIKQEEEEQPKTVIPETVALSAEQPGDTIEVNPPKDSDIELVKETGNSKSEAVPVQEEKPDPSSTEVEEKPREQLQVGEEVVETSKDVETKQETNKSEGASNDTIKEEKIDKEEETGITVNTEQVSSNEEVQAAAANLVEPSPGVEEKVVKEDEKKETGFTDVVSKEVTSVVENPEQASIDQEAKTVLKEENFAVAANDEKEPEAPKAIQGSSTVAEVENKKIEEQNEAKTTTTEAENVKVESVQNDREAVDNKKEENADTKVDEISTAVSEPVRETLASKFEEQDEESNKNGEDNLEKETVEEPVKTEVEATKESEATKTSRDLPKEIPAKPAQKQSNNIISKVKQSLVKAKKAITGKSPSSKNLSSEAKGDIKVK